MQDTGANRVVFYWPWRAAHTLTRFPKIYDQPIFTVPTV